MNNLLDLQAKLDAAQKRADDAQEARAQAKSQQELIDRIAKVERECIEIETLSKLEAELGLEGKAIKKVETSVGMIVVKKPNHLLYKRFLDSDKLDTTVANKLVRSCIVYPSKEEFDKIMEEEPHAIMRCANAVCELAGVRRDEVLGK